MVKASSTASANAFLQFPVIKEKLHSCTRDYAYQNFQFGCFRSLFLADTVTKGLLQNPFLIVLLTLGIFATKDINK